MSPTCPICPTLFLVILMKRLRLLISITQSTWTTKRHVGGQQQPGRYLSNLYAHPAPSFPESLFHIYGFLDLFLSLLIFFFFLPFIRSYLSHSFRFLIACMLAGHFLFVSQELPLAVIHCFRNVLLCIVIHGTETSKRHLSLDVVFFPLCV